jgi:hypothetical protein
VLAFVDVSDFSPRGGLFFPEVVKELVQHCSFQKFPGSLDEWKSEEGGQFLVGKLGKTVIEKMVLYNNGILVETRSGTSDSARVVEEVLDWAQGKFAMACGREAIKRWAYVNDVSFYSDVPLLMTGPIERLARNISAEMSKVLGQETVYEPTGFNIGHDPLLKKYSSAQFTIHRRAEVPFAENKYFSEAPLPTEVHLDLLAQYEKDVAQMLNVR